MTPNSNDEMRLLAPLTRVLFASFDRNTERACHFFESASKSINPYLYPELVRYWVREDLKEHYKVVGDIICEDITKNGISVVFGGRRIRIWKAKEDELPAPGRSQVKKAFLGQQLSFYISNEGVLKQIENNLAILWVVDSRRRLDKLFLALPESVEDDWVPAKAHWIDPIPNPFLSDDTSPNQPVDNEGPGNTGGPGDIDLEPLSETGENEEKSND